MNDKPSIDQRGQVVQGHQTNIAGNVQGSVFSGQFSGPVAMGGEAVDMRGSTGAIYKPTYNIPKAEEIPCIPTIPDPPPDFIGRDDELKELRAKFASGTNIIGLRSNGGVGKTALALKLGESLKDRYPDGQVMVDMRGTSDNPLSPSEAMGSVIHAYHVNEKLPDNEAEIKEMYRRVLNCKRALLLLDNALDDKQVLKLFPPKSSGLLVTSRKTIKLPGLFRKDLYVLKPEEALDLLLKVWCSTSGSEEPPRADPAWSEIARLCGFLPLALRAAASLLANTPDLSPANYAEELKDERTRLERIGMEGVELSVDASFNLSFQRLAPEIQQTFLSASVFPADFDGQAEEHICQDEEHKRLSELARWSLVDYLPQGPDYGRYKLHDLARIFASARQSEESKANIRERHAAYYPSVLWAANELLLKGGVSLQAGLRLFDLEWANIQTGRVWAETNTDKSSELAQICSDFAGAGSILMLKLHPQENVRWLQAALLAARQIMRRDAQGAHLGNLGLAYAALGDAHKAIEYYEQSLAIAREIGDRRHEGSHLDNMGNACADLGDARKAIEYHEQALKIAREIGDRRGEGNALGNLGNAYADLGDARKSIGYYEQALIISREIGDRRGEGANLGNLGLAYAALGDADKAIEYHEQALAIAREIGDRMGEGSDLGNLGIAYKNAGDAKKAIEYHEQALAIAREIGDRRGEGARLGNLGIAHYRLGETHKAIEYYEQAQAISREIGDKRNLGVWQSNLGNAYVTLGETRKAIGYYEQTLKITQEIGDRRGEGAVLGNLGGAYYLLGDVNKAIDYYEQALAIAHEIGDRGGEGTSLWNMSLALDQLGKRAQAIECAKSALKIREEIEDPRAENVRRKLQEWESQQQKQ